MNPLDLPLEVEHFVELGQGPRLVRSARLQQGSERLHFIVQLPLQLGESRLRLLDCADDDVPLIIAEATSSFSARLRNLEKSSLTLDSATFFMCPHPLERR